MLWLTWRQHRSQVLITAALLAALGLFLLINGMGNADVVARLKSDQNALEAALGDRFRLVNNVLTWLPLAPALIGLFWGAPMLAKEFEKGTHRLAWTQSVSLRRWLAVKLGVLSTLVVLAGLAFGTMNSAWLATFEGSSRAERFGNVGMFVVTGVLPAAWWLFAFVVGAAAGAVFRRITPAFAVTLGVVIAAILSLFLFHVRENYATPERLVLDDPARSAPPNDSLIVSSQMIDADGRVIPEQDVFFECGPNRVCGISQNDPDLRQVYYYHPADRYWRFQWTESALLLAATLALGAVAVGRTARSRN
jgi:ABC-type transport system involved in multi-copper enzyme maturation permease subunit